jgi:hypothetical protein
MAQLAICPRCCGQGEISGTQFSCPCGFTFSLPGGEFLVCLPDVKFTGVVTDTDGNAVHG